MPQETKTPKVDWTSVNPLQMDSLNPNIPSVQVPAGGSTGLAAPDLSRIESEAMRPVMAGMEVAAKGGQRGVDLMSSHIKMKANEQARGEQQQEQNLFRGLSMMEATKDTPSRYIAMYQRFLNDPRTPEVMDKSFPGGFKMFTQRYAPENFLDTPDALAERAHNQAEASLKIGKDTKVTEAKVEEAKQQVFIRSLFEMDKPVTIWDAQNGMARSFGTLTEGQQFLSSGQSGYVMPNEDIKALAQFNAGYTALMLNIDDVKKNDSNTSPFNRVQSPGSLFTSVLDNYMGFGLPQEKTMKRLEVSNMHALIEADRNGADTVTLQAPIIENGVFTDKYETVVTPFTKKENPPKGTWSIKKAMAEMFEATPFLPDGRKHPGYYVFEVYAARQPELASVPTSKESDSGLWDWLKKPASPPWSYSIFP